MANKSNNQKKKSQDKDQSVKTPTKKSREININVMMGLLLGITLIAFSPTLFNDFVNWDDYAYIVDNPIIKSLSAKNIGHIFNIHTFVVGNYHPLTVFSYAIEYKLAGIKPAIYHFDNLLLHLINVLLVGLIIWKMTSKVYFTIIVTALFAIHPMHVESVVWAAERKDVLYSLFFLLSVFTYIKYIISDYKIGNAVICFAFFILSLLSKGQAVVLPIVLLLIDYWYKRPLNRNLIIEKIPFLIVAILFGILATQAQSSSLTEQRLLHFSFVDRIFFAAYNLLMYPFKLIFPYSLAGFYGYPLKDEMTLIYLCLPVALILYGYALWKFRNNRTVTFGLLFFLGTIAIVIQLLPIGNAVIADRYTYLPYLGLFFIIGYMVNILIERRPSSKNLILSILSLQGLIFCFKSYSQSQTWKNSQTLWEHVLKVNPDEALAHNNLGTVYLDLKENQKAIEHFQKSIENKENYLEVYKAYSNLGKAYSDIKEYKKSIEAYNKSIDIEPNFETAIFNRGLTFTNMGEYEKAISDFNSALRLNPQNAKAYYSRGVAYKLSNKLKNAIDDYTQAIQIDPAYDGAYLNRGNVKILMQDNKGAIEDYNKTLEINPSSGLAYLNRAKAYYFIGDAKNAISDYKNAEQLGITDSGFGNALKEMSGGQ